MDETPKNTCADEVRKPLVGRDRTGKEILRSKIYECRRVATHLETIEKMLPTELDAAQNAALLELLNRMH